MIYKCTMQSSTLEALENIIVKQHSGNIYCLFLIPVFFLLTYTYDLLLF
jgi:hypothetical protein